MQAKVTFHKDDIDGNIQFSNLIAADCEMMGLQPKRDPLCLIQLYDGAGDCHLIHFTNREYSAPNLKKNFKQRCYVYISLWKTRYGSNLS